MKRLVFCLVACSAVVWSAEPDKLLESLRAEMRAVGNSDAKGDSEGGRSRVHRIESFLSALSAGDPLGDEMQAQTLQAIEQIRAASLSEKINEISGSLAAQLRDRITKKQKELKERLDTTLRKALNDALKAASAKELDEPLRELARLQKDLMLLGYRSDVRLMVNSETVSTVEQIVTMIQDAMLAASNPSAVRGRDAIERLKSAPGNYGRNLGDLIPRSEFLEKLGAISARIMPGQQAKPLARQEFEDRVRDIFSRVKNLDDMDPALTAIDELIAQQREVNGYTSDSGVIYQLRSYRRTYDDLRAGAATSLSFASSSSSDAQSQEVLRPVRDRLVKFALTRVLGVSGDLAPKQDETVATYLHRMLDTAYRTSDWQLMANVLDAAQSMGLTSIVSTNNGLALRQFLAGVNQERARQYSGAVSSYLSALRTGSQSIPVEKIGEKLQEIKAQHPQDYESGVQLANAPAPLPGYYRSTVGYPPGYPPGFSTPGSSSPASTLQVPPVATDVPGGKKKAGPNPSSAGPAKEEKVESAPGKGGGAITPLGELNDRQFKEWLSTVIISEVESPYGNNYTYENEVLKSIRPGLNSARFHPTATIERGKLIVPFTDSNATITIDPSMKKARVSYSTGGDYPAAITPKTKDD